MDRQRHCAPVAIGTCAVTNLRYRALHGIDRGAMAVVTLGALVVLPAKLESVSAEYESTFSRMTLAAKFGT
jgi:hypothetical protein